ncbi:hypothetical protein LTR17_020159 [Elasticomyces elasticus]|nr:hypothetical protein LTR17_020159 [Elasticomyces elasticus]
MAKPVILLVPGAWHTPAHFSRLTAELEIAGYTCIGIDLPSNTRHSPDRHGRLISIDDDTAAVHQAILQQLEEAGRDVLVVTHSYGSIPGLAALDFVKDTVPTAAKRSSKVLGVVVISGFLLPASSTMLECMGGKLPPQYLLEDNLTLPFAGPGAMEILSHDLPINDALKAVWQLEPQSYGVNTCALPDQLAGLKGVTISYLMCKDDHAVPWEVQVATVNGSKSVGFEVRAEIAQSG